MKHLYVIPLFLVALAVPLIAAGFQHGEFIPPGTQIQVRADNPITVARFDRGRVYTAYVERNVYSRDGDLVIPRGAPCELTVRQVGPGQLALDLQSIDVHGRRYVMDASGPEYNVDRERNNDSGNIGNIIGAIAGAAGANVQYQGDRIEVPAGSELTFQTQRPLRVFDHDSGYDRDYDRWNR
jgi:hypothetical protein